MAIRISTMTLIALFLSLATAGTAWAQGSVTDPVPLLNGTDKAKVLFSVPYVSSDAGLATCVSCTNTDKSSATLDELVAFEVYRDGAAENDVTAGEGVATIDYGGDTENICTRNVASVNNEYVMGVAAEDVSLGAGRIVATTTKLICTAFLVPVVGDPPGFMTILPLYKGSKQKGGM